MSPHSGGGACLITCLLITSLLVTYSESASGEECARKCSANNKMKCHFVFNLQLATTLSKSACVNCSLVGNHTDATCLEARCVTASGVKRSFLSINKQLPGPAIQVCQGDTVVVEVNNRLPGGAEVALHWHGQSQRGTPHMDGVAMVTQCPIPPGATFVYQFEAAQIGTHFYHAHSVTQQSDGIYGGLVVNNVLTQNDDNNDLTLLIAPWTNSILSGAYGALHGDLAGSSLQPEALLINGRGVLPQGLQLAQFQLRSGHKNLLRLVNAAAIDCPVRLSLQHHVLHVRRVAGSDVERVSVHSIVLFPGERYDVEVTTDFQADQYILLVQGLNACAKTSAQQAIVRYTTPLVTSSVKQTDSSKIADAVYQLLTSDCSAILDDSALCSASLAARPANSDELLTAPADVELSLPFGRSHVSAVHEEDLEFRFVLQDVAYYPTFLATHSSSALVPHLNNVTFRYPASPPLTHPEDDEAAARLECVTSASSGDEGATRPRDSCRAAPHYCECSHVIRVALNASVQVTLLHTVVPGMDDSAQTVHVHGHGFYVTKWRASSGDWRHVSSPVLRDTVTVPRAGAITFRMKADNPGFWLLEARAGHVTSAGVGAAAMLQVGGRGQLPDLPANFPRCSGHRPDDVIF